MAKILKFTDNIKIDRNNIQPMDNYAYLCVGKIADETGGNFEGYGTATVTKLSETLLQIDYVYTITTQTNLSSDNFDYGLNFNLLKALNTSLADLNAIPLYGGMCVWYNSSWSPITSLMGYGTLHEVVSNHWVCSRNYNKTQVGAWPSYMMSQSGVSFIKGRCFAAY